MVYQNIFENWADVQREYAMTEPEPDEVLVAYYEYEYYEGDSQVLYRNGDKYYYVEGSHCSCYGLEDQWRPEEYSLETLIEAINRTLTTNRQYGFMAKHLNVLPILQSRVQGA